MAEILSGLPVVPLRGIVVFPDMRLHFELGRAKSINAVNAAVRGGGKIFITAQKHMAANEPDFDELYKTGVIASVEQTVQGPTDGKLRIVIRGLERAEMLSQTDAGDHFEAEVAVIKTIEPDIGENYAKALRESLRSMFEEYVNITNKLANDVLIAVLDTDDLGRLSDLIAGNAIEDYTARQSILEERNSLYRAQKLLVILGDMIEIAGLKADIDMKVRERLDKSEREYYLREEMKVISDELDEDESEEEEYREKILALNLPEKIEEKFLKECSKLTKLQPLSPDSNVIRSYLDACLALPWNKYTKENTDIEKAKRILDRDHYGLKKVKDRFIESLCVRQLGAEPNDQIICLVGPPGVGKTSIASCAAKAMGRSFARISLGGVSDEAEIRGHRRTYIGAMPGRIINALTQAGSSNALILLDEIDKLGKDYKGDPASALLEVLDGEQNSAFVDHFIEVPFDLSKTIFVTTANDPSDIPPALYDRMEKIEMESYTFEEKVNIATKHLVKKEMKQHGLNSSNFCLRKSAIEAIIEKYTREAGVRDLEKKIAAVCRKAAVRIVEGEEKVVVSDKNLGEFLSAAKFIQQPATEDRVGVVNGLAWTAAGGEMLEVEAIALDGTGKIEITGNLGDVMNESAKLAVSVVRSVSEEYGLDKNFYKNKDIHIHVPQGAVPKDGPSAGVTLSTALLSALSGRKVRGDIAMTGEISLTGRVMPIGGLKEKSMAAYKNKIKKVIIPDENLSDLSEITEAVRGKVEFVPVKNLSEVFSIALI